MFPKMGAHEVCMKQFAPEDSVVGGQEISDIDYKEDRPSHWFDQQQHASLMFNV